jgi:hypothetical protein
MATAACFKRKLTSEFVTVLSPHAVVIHGILFKTKYRLTSSPDQGQGFPDVFGPSQR